LKRSLFYSLLLLCCLSLLLCCGCGRQEIQQNQELIDLQTYQPETVYIGATLPLSGEHSSLGQDSRAAMEVAVDIINNSHELDWDLARGKGITGFGNAQVELVFSDCESNEILTADAADALLNQGVVAMVGAGRSEYTAEKSSRGGAEEDRTDHDGHERERDREDPDRNRHEELQDHDESREDRRAHKSLNVGFVFVHIFFLLAAVSVCPNIAHTQYSTLFCVLQAFFYISVDRNPFA